MSNKKVELDKKCELSDEDLKAVLGGENRKREINVQRYKKKEK